MSTNHGWKGVFDLVIEDIYGDDYEHTIGESNADLLVTWEEECNMWIISYTDGDGMLCVHHNFLYLAFSELLKQMEEE